MRLSERIRVVVFLIVGLTAIGLLTWGLGKIYLELVGHAGSKTVEEAPSGQKANQLTDSVLNLSEVKFWTCQVGVFQSEGNAQLRKEQLGMLDLKAEIISNNPWIVVFGWGHSAEELKEVRLSLAEQGISTVPKQIVLPERSFRVAGNGSLLTMELLTNVNTILQEGLTVEALAEEEQVWNALAGNYPPKELAGLHQYYCEIREQTTFKSQKGIIFTLFVESQRVIKILSGNN